MLARAFQIFPEQIYLELSQGETAALTDLAVVLDGRASHNRAEEVDGAGSDLGGLGLTRDTAAVLLAGLFRCC